jgi:hypothetical protein
MSDTPQSPVSSSQQPVTSSLRDTLSSLQYGEAYTYVFNNPNWGLTLLFGSICQLLPVVGPMVLMGYQFEIIEALQRGGRGGYPDFIFDRFGDYLKRGVWPFLVQLVVSLVVGLPLTMFLYVMMFAVTLLACAAGPRVGPVVACLGIGVSAVVFTGVLVLIGFLTVPLYLRAGLTQDFSEAFRLEFIKDFVRKVWKEMLLGGLFMGVTSIVLAFVGMGVCCVGVYPAAALIMLATAHIYYQLYHLYLSRGGVPILLKPAVTVELR